MSRATWTLIKANKNFNVHIYRRGLKVLICSLLLSAVLGGFISKIYLNEPERDYYSTDGITPPVQLTPMLAPNMSSHAMLDADPITASDEKVIPQ